MEKEEIIIDIPGLEMDISREALAEAAPKKRGGRKPGSKNKPKGSTAAEPAEVVETPAVKDLEEKRKAAVNNEPKIPMPKNASAPSSDVLGDLKARQAKKRKEEAAIKAKIAADPDIPNARITALEARMSAIEARMNAAK